MRKLEAFSTNARHNNMVKRDLQGQDQAVDDMKMKLLGNELLKVKVATTTSKAKPPVRD